MLPRKRAPPARRGGRAPGGLAALLASPRRLAVAAAGLLFLVYMYFNVRFFALSSVASNGIGLAGGAATPAPKSAALRSPRDPLAFHGDARQVRHVAFTSGCAPLDFVQSEVLAFTLRRTGFDGNVTHLLYGCSAADAAALALRKNPAHGVSTQFLAHVPAAPAAAFGEKLLTTNLNPVALLQWLSQDLPGLRDDDFVMVVDSDAIFTKRLDMVLLEREARDMPDSTIYGQDASWYWPNRFPLSQADLEAVVSDSSPASSIVDWRPFAAVPPYVAELSTLRTLLPDTVRFWDALPHEKKYLAMPLAAAHHGVWMGISGVLSVHHYISRYQNWDFVDDIKSNPCAGLPPPSDVAIWSYPISLRALNFTLPQWVDGSEWSFFDAQVPPDFLDCDAWLFKQPTERLWRQATHTNGFEHVPNILRRRHTMSVCLALEAYNSAAIDHRSNACPGGFNRNRKMPMEFEKPAWRSAIALSSNTEMRDDPPVFFGEYKRKMPADADTAAKAEEDASDKLHFVFSSSCEPYQHWQSQLLAESFARVQQRGRLTRIVSGCSDEQLVDLMERHGASSLPSMSTPRVELHVTKSFAVKPTPEASPSDDYAPYNKPFGLRDWLRHANPPVRPDATIVIIDPDFLFLKPFSIDTRARVTSARGVDSKNYVRDGEVVDGLRQYKKFFVYEGQRELTSVRAEVRDGLAVAQRWTAYLGSAGFDNPKAIADMCPECGSVTADDAREYYAVGPPYVLTRSDLDKIVDDYCAFTVAQRVARPDVWMAEMLGYSLAAAKHGLKHTTFDNLALGGKADDYFDFVELIKGNPCSSGPEFRPVKAASDVVEPPLIPGEAPALLHGCHSYRATDDRGLEWLYYKQYVPNDMFACDSWLLAEPPASVWTLAKKQKDVKLMQQAYGLCTTIRTVNRALVDFKTRACPNGFNANKRLRIVAPPRPAERLEVGRVDAKWAEAAQAHEPLLSNVKLSV